VWFRSQVLSFNLKKQSMTFSLEKMATARPASIPNLTPAPQNSFAIKIKLKLGGKQPPTFFCLSFLFYVSLFVFLPFCFLSVSIYQAQITFRCNFIWICKWCHLNSGKVGTWSFYDELKMFSILIKVMQQKIKTCWFYHII
jgi:hypothetical protein